MTKEELLNKEKRVLEVSMRLLLKRAVISRPHAARLLAMTAICHCLHACIGAKTTMRCSWRQRTQK